MALALLFVGNSMVPLYSVRASPYSALKITLLLPMLLTVLTVLILVILVCP
jgi:hypothetical protein